MDKVDDVKIREQAYEKTVRRESFQFFKEVMMRKEEFRRSGDGARTDVHGHHRPILPWLHYSEDEIYTWLKKEMKELDKAMDEIKNLTTNAPDDYTKEEIDELVEEIKSNIRDECSDVANLAMFLHMRMMI